jgi:teichuronic acid biosynthesis glycosyltransferase TuaG
MKLTLVSIITPCLNAQKYLDKMISSVISQTYKNWELIIVDDFSNDDSVKIVKKFLNQCPRIKLLRLSKRSGTASARNEGINFAEGRYLTFLDADDYWGDNFLKYSVKNINNNSFIYSDLNFVDEAGKFIDKISSIPKVNYNGILKGTPISCLTAFIDLKKIGKKLFPVNTYREDIAYWLLLLKDCKEARGFSFCEANYRYRKDSSSANKFKMAFQTWQDYRNQYNLSFIKALYFFSFYAFNGFKKFSLFYFVKTLNNLKTINFFKLKK